MIQTGDIDKITSLASDQETSNHFKVDSHEPLKEVLGKDIITKEFTDILVQLEQSKDPQFILIEWYRQIIFIKRNSIQVG